MQLLNFPKYHFKLKEINNRLNIFDPIRKKYIVLTPEEWVRQHVVEYLIQNCSFPKSHINLEKEIKINGLAKRYDIVVFKPNGGIFLLVECKAPNIKIDQAVFDQIARYNINLNAEYLMVSNGLNHYFCQMNFTEKTYIFLKEVPSYKL